MKQKLLPLQDFERWLYSYDQALYLKVWRRCKDQGLYTLLSIIKTKINSPKRNAIQVAYAEFLLAGSPEVN